jgi:hypothetical protein
MSSFDKREAAFENKYAHDEEMRFKIAARRDKLTGFWAAGLLGLGKEAAESYAKSIVMADLEEAGDEDVVRKLVSDLQGKATDAEIRTKLHENAIVAQEQIEKGF